MCLPFRNLDRTEQNFQDPSSKEPPKDSGGLSSRLLRLGESDFVVTCQNVTTMYRLIESMKYRSPVGVRRVAAIGVEEEDTNNEGIEKLQTIKIETLFSEMA